MEVLSQFVDVVEKFSNVADFITVYISEVHATDGWSFKTNPYKIKQHQHLEDRITAAKMLKEKNLPCPLVVDTMTDEASKLYGALPERLFIILNGRVVYEGRQGPFGYNAEEMCEKLQSLLLSNK